MKFTANLPKSKLEDMPEKYQERICNWFGHKLTAEQLLHVHDDGAGTINASVLLDIGHPEIHFVRMFPIGRNIELSTDQIIHIME